MSEPRAEHRTGTICARAGLFVGTVLASQIPYVLGVMLIWREQFHWATIASFLGVIMMVVAPFVARKRWPAAGGFHVMLVPRKPGKILLSLLGVPLLTLCFFVLALAAGAILVRAGLWRGRKSWVVVTNVPLSHTLVIGKALLSMLLGPIAQEFFWRGYALSYLKTMTPWPWAIVIQALLFSLSHCSALDASVVSLVFGLVFGYWAHRSGHLLTVILAHITWNVLILGQMFWLMLSRV